MKKFIFVASALLLMSMQVVAQKYFDVYQNGKLTISIPATSVDSVGLTGSTMENRKVNFYRSDNTVNSFLVSTVDSIKIFKTGDEQLVYLGIVGFNQDLYIKPIDVLANSTAGFYTSYVSDLERKDGTLLYYAVDRALYLLSSKDFPTPLSSVNLVTFTDGLDQGSLMMNGNYYTDEQYLDAVNSRICNTTVKGLPVTAYSLGMRGSDVSDYTKFQNNLKKLASSADKAFEVSSMGDVSTRLQEISDRIISISNRQNFSFKIPGQSNGTVIRFTFDGYSADNSKMYIEGTFNLANRSLNNVSYHGIRATSGSYIQGTQNGIFVTFTFTGMQREDGNGLIPQFNVREYYKSAGSSTWQQNSEFSPSDNTQTTVTHSGAAIMLVLDCSNSLGSQFSNMKSYAQNFINRVANNTKEFKVEAPQNVTATLTDNFDVAISWDAVKHAEYYVIMRSDDLKGTYSTVSNDVTSTSWTDTAPLKGYNYYKVIAYGHGLDSNNSSNVIIEVQVPSCPDVHHPHLIDLGLPSGTKWACCNVGASKPEYYGGYFAWGETTEKSYYDWSTYVHCDGSSSTCHDIGKDIAGTQYDAATANWGSPWVMPNLDQMNELKNNCTSEWTTENGVNGLRFTGPNGASIFLPTVGYRFEDDWYIAGSSGRYWLSSLYESYTYRAWHLYFNYSGSMDTGYGNRLFGLSVRPVRKN